MRKKMHFVMLDAKQNLVIQDFVSTPETGVRFVYCIELDNYCYLWQYSDQKELDSFYLYKDHPAYGYSWENFDWIEIHLEEQ